MTIDFPGDDFLPCDPVSTEVGYDQTVTMNGSGNQATVDFTINTSTVGDFDTSSLLCFKLGNIQYCYTLNIEIDPCPVPPTDCVQEWDAKSAGGCELVDGMYKFSFNMKNVSLILSNRTVCNDGIFASMEGGGTVEVLSGSIHGNSISFDTDIYMPCDFDQTLPYYEMKLYFCNSKGEVVCLLFRVSFPPCNLDCNDKGDETIKGRSVGIYGGNQVYLYPNPAFDNIQLEIKNSITKQHNVQIQDHIGKLVMDHTFEQNITLDVSHLQSGLHFVKVHGKDGQLISIEKLIILK